MRLGCGRRYPRVRSVHLSTEAHESLLATAERYDLTPSVILREAVEHGLLAIAERYRQRYKARDNRQKSRQERLLSLGTESGTVDSK